MDQKLEAEEASTVIGTGHRELFAAVISCVIQIFK